MNNIEKLLEELSNHGVCETGKRWLRGQRKDMETLVHVWRRWPEYFMEHYDFALDVMRRHLTETDKEVLANNRLYIDEHFIVSGMQFPGEPVFLLGDSDITMCFEQFGTARFYLFGKSNLKVIGDSTTLLTIDMFGESALIIDGNMKPLVHRYNGNEVNGFADIKDKTYCKGEVFNGKEMEGYDIGSW